MYWTEARVTEAGWIAEVAIPFTTLRYPEDAAFDMGVAFYRLIQRKKEEDMWPAIGLKYRQQIFQVSQYARLTGFHDLPRHHNVEVRPYGLAGAQQTGASRPIDVVKNAGFDVKVSRPIVRCQEMSRMTPTITLVDANRTAYRNHGTAPEIVPAHSSRASSTCAGVGMAFHFRRDGARDRRSCEGCAAL